MKRHTFPRLTAYALVGSTLITSAAFAQEAKGSIFKLLHPPASSIASADANEDLTREIRRLLWETRSVATLWNLGEAAVPVFSELTRTCPLSKLINEDYYLSPFFWLSEVSPETAMGTLLGLSESDPERFRLLIRRGLGPFGVNDGFYIEGFAEKAWERPTPELTASAQSFLETVLKDSEVPLREKVSVFCLAFELGVSTVSSSEVIQANLKEAAPYLGVKGLRHFALNDLAEVPSDLEEALALRVLETLEPTVSAPPLTSSPHARVREKAFTKAAARGFDRSDFIELIIARKDEPSPRVQGMMLTIMYNAGIPNSSEVTLEQLVPLVEFALRHQTMNSSLSERLTNVVIARVSEADPSDAPIVSELVRTIYDGEQPPVSLRFASQGVASRIRSIAMAQAIVEGASGTLHQPDDLIQSIAVTWISANKARTHPESAALLYSAYASFQPSDHKASLPRDGTNLAALSPELAPGALAWLGQTDSRYDEVAAISPSYWSGAMDALRASAFGDARPWQERCIAMVALLHQPEVADEDVDRIAEQLGANLGDPESERQFSTYMDEATGSWGHPLSFAWNRVVEKLLASPNVTHETTKHLYLTGAAGTDTELDVISRVLKLAAGRLVATTQTAQFSGLVTTSATEEMRHWAAKGPLIPDALLAHWIDHLLTNSGRHRDELMGVILLRDDSVMADRALTALAQQLRSVAKQQARMSLVNAMLQLPGEASERVVIALAPQYLSYDDRDTAFGKIRARRKAELFQAELLAPKSTAPPTRESALLAVLALLDHERESVRIEAIRGLGTLSAIETLPRLIVIVGSGSEAEQAAARETLDLLRRIAESK